MKTKILLFALIGSLFYMTSCSKEEDNTPSCKDCGISVELLMHDTTLAYYDDIYQAMGFEDTQDYYDQMYPEVEELCGDDLAEAEAEEDIVVPGMYRMYVDCN